MVELARDSSVGSATARRSSYLGVDSGCTSNVGSTSVRAGSPSPSNTADAKVWTPAWFRARYRAGELPYVPVEAPAVVPGMPPLARAVYEDMRLLWGLRLGQLEDRPLMYAASEPVGLGLCEHKTQASRALHWLERERFVWSPGAMPPAKRPDGMRWKYGTRTFLPGRRPEGPVDLVEGQAVGVEGRAIVVRQADDPEVEVVDEPGVPAAIVDGEGRGGLDASVGTAPLHGRIAPQPLDIDW
jgi:hypothetical protein